MDDKHTNQSENNEGVQADRGIPSVTNTDRKNIVFGAILIVVAIIAMIIIVMDDMDKSEPKSLITPEKVTFKGSGQSSPYIDTSPLEAKTAPPPRPQPTTVQTINPNEIAMQREAIRLALEQQKRMEKRKRSKQLVLDESSNQIPNSQSTQTSNNAGGASFLSGGNTDPNLAFANKYSNQDVETVTASQLPNLHALIPQGTMISGILETAIQSDLPGMVRAIVRDNVYSFDGSHLLIPKGSKLIGRYRSALVRGQTRVFIIWNRLIRKDGVSVNIGSIGTDALGRSGLEGHLDTHFFERFGSSLLLSLIDTGLTIGAESIDNDNTSTVALESGNNFSRTAEIALENSIAIPPTIRIDQGVKINVFVGKDLDFSKVAGNMPKGYKP